APKRRVGWHPRALRTKHRGRFANALPFGKVCNMLTDGAQAAVHSTRRKAASTCRGGWSAAERCPRADCCARRQTGPALGRASDARARTLAAVCAKPRRKNRARLRDRVEPLNV